MLLLNLEHVTADFLRQLCVDRCPESGSLDFKRALPSSSDQDKQELLKDVSAFANTDGGDLVYGIKDKDGKAEVATPITDESADAAKRRLSQILDAGLEPRVQGIRFRDVEIDDGYVLIVRVPASFDGPHCARRDNLRRFVMRNGTATSDLTYDQLRAAFDRTATLAEKARRFIEQRQQLIIDHKTPKPLMAGPIWVVHLIPIAGLAGRQSVDLRALWDKGFDQFRGEDWRVCRRLLKLDGLVLDDGEQSGKVYGYTHIFRTGALEAAYAGQVLPGNPQKPSTSSMGMTRFFRERVDTFIDAAKNGGFAGPAVLCFAVLHVEGYELGIGDSFRPFGKMAADRPHLILPEVWIENLDSANLDDLVRPLLDTLWQAFGEVRCLDFDADTGDYKPRGS